MRKAVAIPYIIALVLGMIVLVFVVYWIYRSFTGQGINCNECKSQFIDWCTRCALANKGKTDWDTNIASNSPSCAQTCDFTGGSISCSDAEDECKAVGVEPIT